MMKPKTVKITCSKESNKELKDIKSEIKIVRDAKECKDEGNAYFARKKYSDAVTSYLDGVKLLKKDDNDDNNILLASLRSNLAGAYLKMESYVEVERQCTIVINELDSKNAKVWYRRALAREKLITVNLEEQGNASECIKKVNEAVQDLETSLRILETKQQTQETRTVHTVLERLNNLLHFLANKGSLSSHDEENLINGAKKCELANNALRQNQKVPSPAQQREDVRRLLKARKMGFQNKKSSTSPIGEAFFFIDWPWWCSWCRYADFFYQNEEISSNASNTDAKDQTEPLALLLQGSIIPKKIPKEEEEEISVSSEESQSQNINQAIPPGPIDNSNLLLPPLTGVFTPSAKSAFYRQLYQHNKSTSIEGTRSYTSSSLRPNLVRGHHFELLPREVYCALRSWYGETSPSVCRRTTMLETDTSSQKNVGKYRATVKLYPLISDRVNKNDSCETTICGACRALFATARCKRCMSVHYCDRICQESHWHHHKTRCKQVTSDGVIEKQPDLDSGGKVGLNNLGNTCFMNSALQCLSHSTPLTRHFLSSRFRADLNSSNPLGTGGMLANAFDSVMKEIWTKNKNIRGSTSPTALKRAISAFAPRFAGCLQHDAQEFLAYLLDGLHEDLNRIRKAPYVEMPDANGKENMAIAGAEAWDAHRRRNDSLIMDNFYGQFKSTCICPKCDRLSVSFDTFNHISLEIPHLHKTTILIPVLMMQTPFRKGNGIPMRYGISVRSGGLVGDVRLELSNLCGIPTTRIILCDVYDSVICEILPDNKSVLSIRSSELITAYEVDPYTSASIHVIACHAVPNSSDNASKTLEEDTNECFGFPFLTSFRADYACKEVWDHIWQLVRYTVIDLASGDEEVNDAPHKDLLQIRVVNNERNPEPVFPSPLNSLDDLECHLTSILPSKIDEKVSTYLGEECTSRFLFLTLEWGKHAADGETQKCSEPLIQESRFLAHDDHHSLVEAIRKQRSMNGMKGVTLDQCLETFTKPERLDEHNMWYCSECNEHVRALKTMELWRLPNILIVHLKRFEFSHGFRRDKLDTFVEFPIDGLDMSKHCAYWNSQRNAKENDAHLFVDDLIPAEYDLFAVVNHYGRMGFGHYTAFARKWDEVEISTDWALFDDSSVRNLGDGRSGPDGVVSPAAYVLFYRKRIFN